MDEFGNPTQAQPEATEEAPQKSNLDTLKEEFEAHNQINPVVLIMVLNDLAGIENAAPVKASTEEGNAE